MKILVTGANGQLGQALSNRLESVMPGITTYADRATLELTDADAVCRYVEEGQFTHIVNCAGYTAVDLAESEAQKCRAANVVAVGNLATAARNGEVKMIHISTDYVFDGTRNVPYTESDRVNPLSEYGRSKRSGEMLMLDTAPEGIIIRTAGLYSQWGRNFVKTIRSLAMRGEKAKVVIDQLVAPTYAPDLAAAITDILNSPRWIGGIFNYSNMGITSWYDIAVEIYRACGRSAADVRPSLSRDYPSIATRPAFSVLDKSLISSTYGVAIPHWRESLEECLGRMDAEA